MTVWSGAGTSGPRQARRARVIPASARGPVLPVVVRLGGPSRHHSSQWRFPFPAARLPGLRPRPRAGRGRDRDTPQDAPASPHHPHHPDLPKPLNVIPGNLTGPRGRQATAWGVKGCRLTISLAPTPASCPSQMEIRAPVVITSRDRSRSGIRPSRFRPAFRQAPGASPPPEPPLCRQTTGCFGHIVCQSQHRPGWLNKKLFSENWMQDRNNSEEQLSG